MTWCLKNGVLIDPLSTFDITQTLEMLTTSEDLRKDFGIRLQQKITKEFSLSKMIDATIRQYHH